jgi:putative protease
MSERKIPKIELLAPAGSYDIFRAVLAAGADAVYLGGSRFGARAYADNFSEDELLRAIDEAHLHGKAIYLTVNTLFKEEELERQLYEYLLPYYRQGLDAVIVQDMGAFALIRREFPDMHIHTSTQMTVTGRYGAAYMKKLGASRIVTAREMSLEEIKDIRDHVDIEIESFVHGALCYCYSGQCLLSSMLGGRSGNRGRCAQPCRLPYEACDIEHRPIRTKGEFVLSPKDLNTIEAIPALAECGIDSFKIEGRMKQAEYAATVVSVYRSYLDRYREKPQDFSVDKADLQRLYNAGNRSGFTDGYYFRRNGKEMITFEKPNHAKAADGTKCEFTETKEKIKGILKLKKDFPAMLEITCGMQQVTAEGNVVQAALKQPLSREKIAASIQKTGNTPFVFETLHIDMDEDVFLPVQALNALRRDALEQMEEQLLAGYRRRALTPETCMAERATEAMTGDCHEVAYTDKPKDMTHLSVSIEKRSQLEAVLPYEFVDDIYLDSSCYTRERLFKELSADAASVRKSGKRAYFILPAVFRKQTADFYLQNQAAFLDCGLDGIVVKSVDAAAFAAEYLRGQMDMIFDHSIYSWNNRAKKLLWQLEPLRDTAPLELNRRELYARNNANSEVMLYGVIPLMTSAQCVHANTGQCDGKPTVMYLKDRYGKYFPVKNNCSECYNTIYNTTPLVLFQFMEDFEKMKMFGGRIAFTIEEKSEIHKVMELYGQVRAHVVADVNTVFSKGSYTNGHFKRGVE